MATLKQVAAAAGVSTFTVSRVLSGRGRESRISPERISQVEKTAAELGYRPNAAARATRERRSRQIGVLTFTQAGAHDFASLNQLLVHGINSELERFGYLTSLIRLNDLIETDGVRHRAFAEQIVDGIAALNFLPNSIEQTLGESFKHCVWVDGNRFDDARCLRRDERLAGRLLVEHAARVGYKSVLYVDDVQDYSGMPLLDGSTHYSRIDRLEGVSVAAAEHGLKLDIVACSHRWRDEHRRYGKGFAPDQMVIAYDMARARMAIRSATEWGKLVGRDFGLSCCEGSPDFEADWPGLCHSEFDRFAMGEQAARMLVQQIDESLASADPDKIVADADAADAEEPRVQVPTLIAGETAPGPDA